MKKILFLLWSGLLLTTCLSAQKDNCVTVKAGARVQDCTFYEKRYRFPEFTTGLVMFKNGAYAQPKLNYNFLMGEMEYVESKDTLSIAKPEEIRLIAFEKDTFFYDKGYLELIYSGKVKVARKEYFELKQILKKDSYGASGSNASTDSYNAVDINGSTYKLIASYDRVFEKIVKYYLAYDSGGFVAFTKKKVMQQFPQEKDAIDAYLKTNQVDFDSENDLLRFAGFLQSII